MYSPNFAHNSKKYSYLAFKNTEIRSKNKRRNKAEFARCIFEKKKANAFFSKSKIRLSD